MQILLHIKNAQYAGRCSLCATMLFKFNRKDKLLFKLLIVKMLFQKSLKSRHTQNERGSTHISGYKRNYRHGILKHHF